MQNLALTIMRVLFALAITVCLSGTAEAQALPAEMLFDLEPKPAQNPLHFDPGGSETEDYCVCLHKVCFPAGDQGQYIKCKCEWLSCVDLNMRPY